MPQINLNQIHLREQMITYLKQQGRDTELIDQLKQSKGLCFGLTQLILFHAQQFNSTTERNSLAWASELLNKITKPLDLIAAWNPNRPINKTTQDAFEYVLSTVLYMHDARKHRTNSPYREADNLTWLNDKGDVYQREYTLTGAFCAEDLIRKLDIPGTNTKSILEILTQENKMVFIAANNHATGLIRIPNTKFVIYYNSNYKESPPVFNLESDKSQRALAELILASHLAKPNERMNIGFSIVDKTMQPTMYPQQSEVLKRINPRAIPEPKQGGLNPLFMTGVIGDIKSFDYHINHSCKDFSDHNKFATLCAAAKTGQSEFLEHAFKLKIPITDRSALLASAGNYNQVDCLYVMIKHGIATPAEAAASLKNSTARIELLQKIIQDTLQQTNHASSLRFMDSKRYAENIKQLSNNFKSELLAAFKQALDELPTPEEKIKLCHLATREQGNLLYAVFHSARGMFGIAPKPDRGILKLVHETENEVQEQLLNKHLNQI